MYLNVKHENYGVFYGKAWKYQSERPQIRLYSSFTSIHVYARSLTELNSWWLRYRGMHIRYLVWCFGVARVTVNYVTHALSQQP
jgi:hypothetical protein